MKRVIYKYPLKVTDVQDIEIPHGSILLSVQTQNETPCLWVLIYDTKAEKEVIRLRTIKKYNMYNVKFTTGGFYVWDCKRFQKWFQENESACIKKSDTVNQKMGKLMEHFDTDEISILK